VTINVFDKDEDSLFGSCYPDVGVAFRLDKFEHYETGLCSGKFI